MTTEEKNNKIVEDLLKDLRTNDPKTLTSALKRVRSKGNEKVIPSLFKIIEESTEESIVEESKKIILELKSTAAIPYLLEELENNKNSEIRELVLNSFWQTGFNAHQHMDKFVTAATIGTFMEAFEAYTIIDNLEGPFQEESIMEAQLILKSYFSESNEEDEKYEILKNIAKQLANYELTIQ
jgi:hypothetical protein